MFADGHARAYRVHAAQVDGHTRIVLAGEIDLAARDALDDAIGSAGTHGGLILDLTDVSFLDSTGLEAIARAVRDRGDVGVLNPRPAVRRVLEVSGIDKLIDISDGASEHVDDL